MISNPVKELESNEINKIDNYTNLMNNDTYKIDIHEIIDFPTIAFVKPIFTATAYSSFYSGFRVGINTKNGYYGYPKLDATNYFNHKIVNSWSTSSGIVSYINELKTKYDNINIITDLDLHNGAVFDKSGNPIYSTLVFMHNEYVTMQEYYNLIRFIKAGGNAIILNGNAFFAEVDYDPNSQNVKLVSGHGWQFDGRNGTRSDAYYRFYKSIGNFEHSDFIGSRYCSFNKGSTNGANVNYNNLNPHPIALSLYENGITKIAQNYVSHEENCLITPNVHKIASWDPNFEVDHRGLHVYEIFPHGSYGGSIIHFSIFGSNQMSSKSDLKQLFELCVRHQSNQLIKPWIRYPMNNAYLKSNIILDYDSFWDTKVFINNKYYENIKNGQSLDFLGEGDYNLTIEFFKNNYKTVKQIKFTIDNTNPEMHINGQPINKNSIYTMIPNQEYNISLIDKSIEIYVIQGYSKVRELVGGVYSGYRNGGNFQYRNFTSDPIIFKPMSNKAYYGVTLLDSAGNTNLFWLNTNNQSDIDITRNYSPQYMKYNNTMIKLSIPKVEDNVQAYLQISSDYGLNWVNYNLKHDNTSSYYNYVRENEKFWFRFAIRSNNITEYLHDIKSFQWETDVIAIENILQNDTTINLYLSKLFNEYNYNLTLNYKFVNNSNFVISNNAYNLSNFGLIFNIINSSDIHYVEMNLKINSNTANYSLTKKFMHKLFSHPKIDDLVIENKKDNISYLKQSVTNNRSNYMVILHNDKVIKITKANIIDIFVYNNLDLIVQSYDHFGFLIYNITIQFTGNIYPLPEIKFDTMNEFNLFDNDIIPIAKINNAIGYNCSISIDDVQYQNFNISINNYELFINSSKINNLDTYTLIKIELTIANFSFEDSKSIYFYNTPNVTPSNSTSSSSSTISETSTINNTLTSTITTQINDRTTYTNLESAQSTINTSTNENSNFYFSIIYIPMIRVIIQKVNIAKLKYKT